MPSWDEQFSNSDSDDGFNEDMEALKRAFQLTGTSPNDHKGSLSTAAHSGGGGGGDGALLESESDDDDGEDDIEMVRNIQKRFAISTEAEEPLTLKPLCTLPPLGWDSDDGDDDFETLRAIQRRFMAYDDGALKDHVEDFLHIPEQVGASVIDSEKETSNNLIVERTNAHEGFSNCVDTKEAGAQLPEACDDEGVVGARPSNLIEWDGPRGDDVAGLPVRNSDFPSSALAFVDAIKKNRSCQKLMRSKLGEIEARIEEIKRLKDRVKILKDFQVACRMRTGRAFSQKKDARVQLISVPKLKANAKFNEKKIPAIYKGPPENSHVANYKEALTSFPVSVNREKWSNKERENLVKGVKQQFQKMLLQQSIDMLSDGDGSSGDSNNVDSIVSSIKGLDITPEIMRSFLPKVNWEQLVFMYVPCRTGVECQARWLNCEDPLINGHPWTTIEDKNLLHNIQQKGVSNWIDIAVSLGTNRTPFQCLARYQRSLNASILKREWTEEEDNQLRAAVENFGESNWQHVASLIEGRTGTQCSNRWMKTLHPTRKRVGRWTADEDKRLKVAVTIFGPKTWKKVAKFVPGRTQAQCRERWVNCLDPSLNLAAWTEEEDSKLEAAILKHGYYWSKVAACVPPRTDNQCRRRWKVLFPHEVPQLQAARKIQKAALISNFVDRESERPALGPNDFVPLPNCITESKKVDPSSGKKRRSRRRKDCTEKDAPSGEICPEEVPRLTNGDEIENMHGRSVPRKKRNKRLHSIKGKRWMAQPSEECEGSNPTEEHPSPLTDPNTLMITMSEELVDVGGNDAIEINKASKLRPRRRCIESHEEVPPETLSTVETLVGDANLLKMKKITNNKNKGIVPANGDGSEKFGGESFSRGGGIGPNKRCRSNFGTEVSGDGEDFLLSSGRDNELQCVENSEMQSQECLVRGKFSTPIIMESADYMPSSFGSQEKPERSKDKRAPCDKLSGTVENDTTPASFLVQSGSEEKHYSSTKFDESPRKQDQIFEVQNISNVHGLPYTYRRKRRGRDESRPNQTVEVEAGDDMPLAVFYNEQKKRRRVEATKK
ncbi:uncharacterized protein Fot_47928 [Forsythia ovata]|uniref:Uncharacterized protein n=1 Tax=Forsythia ovata TaxID=205694 RepID=A0ABD1QVF2_9LAMI